MKRVTPPSPRAPGQRSGIVLILVLACVAVITLLLGGMVRGCLLWDRQTRQELRAVQAEILADSGLARAAFRLREDPDFRAEQWRLTPADGVMSAATVEIAVRDGATPRTAIVRIEVHFAPASARPIRVVRERPLRTLTKEGSL